ncbi:MAG: hypothetical protein CMN25_02330 [Salinicola sp.]|uniref:hypothetical protein n=1 Tax=Salinicola sp. TaxID=1978524 RepID=UPI000C92281C|nr:hypothetical protein [Salinicola sp.]MAM56151.1 hypothetical protein [Salinicola sp.]NRB54427.1 hypothetical protein [Salinicola sp.]|tara:strand:+ start:1762 stop:1956 length:195 start_codon:yes stop_codon:yes gene_type:complete
MMTVTLNLDCSVCGHHRFHLPIKQEEGARVTCANCSAYKCQIRDLEKALIAAGRNRYRTAVSAA